MGISPEETVFIGDSPEADIAGARSVGMKAVLRVTSRMEANGALISYHPRLRTMDGTAGDPGRVVPRLAQW